MVGTVTLCAAAAQQSYIPSCDSASCYGSIQGTWANTVTTTVPDFFPTCECVFDPTKFIDACVPDEGLVGKAKKLLLAVAGLYGQVGSSGGGSRRLLQDDQSLNSTLDNLKEPLKMFVATSTEFALEVSTKMEMWGLCPTPFDQGACNGKRSSLSNTAVFLQGAGASSPYLAEIVLQQTIMPVATSGGSPSSQPSATPSIALVVASMEALFTPDDAVAVLQQQGITPLVPLQAPPSTGTSSWQDVAATAAQKAGMEVAEILMCAHRDSGVQASCNLNANIP